MDSWDSKSRFELVLRHHCYPGPDQAGFFSSLFLHLCLLGNLGLEQHSVHSLSQESRCLGLLHSSEGTDAWWGRLFQKSQWSCSVTCLDQSVTQYVGSGVLDHCWIHSCDVRPWLCICFWNLCTCSEVPLKWVVPFVEFRGKQTKASVDMALLLVHLVGLHVVIP